MTKPIIKIPDTFMGVPVEGAMERVLSKDSQKPNPITTPDTAQPGSGFVYIPEPNIYFANQRTHLGKKWDETHEALKTERLRMPTIPEFAKTLKYLRDSNIEEYQELYKEITEVRTPWRSEWIDAYFEKRKDGLYVLTGNKSKAEKLEDCLMKDKTPGINLDDWVSGKNITSQGLPKTNINNGGLYYWYPRDGKVAGFNAGFDRAVLSCNRDPSGGDSTLGVFAVKDNGGNARQKS